MAIEAYFVNETKKQIVSSKKLSGYFEEDIQIICYLNLCIGDTIRTGYENDVEDILYPKRGSEKEYKSINLYEFKINSFGNLLRNDEFERLEKVVNT